MIEKGDKNRFAYLLIISGTLLNVVGIYYLVTEIMKSGDHWYYGLILLVIGDGFLISGMRRMTKNIKK